MTGGSRRAWMLDEQRTIGRENVDPAHVSLYDEKEDAGAAGEVRFLQSAGMTPDATVVDLGSGTGQFALAVAPVCRRVIAVEPSAVMRERLARKVEASGVSVEVADAGFLTYTHEGKPADAAYSRYALHHIPDFWKAVALSRIRSMLRPGGLFRLWDVVYHFPLEEVEERIDRWCASLPEEAPPGEWIRADVEEHVRDEHSTFSWLLEPMLAQAGFSIRVAEYSEDGFFAKYLLQAR